ncbi:hypothetical protein Tco_1351116 [Tanacetum coccineum]
MVHKRRPMTPDGRLVLKKKVFRWLKEGMIKKVRHPVWVTNTIPVKLANGTWKVQADYSSLNKVCAKDIYPFLKEGEGLASTMGYLIKELGFYTSEDDGEGLSRSKMTERGNILGRNSNKKQNKGRKVSRLYGNKGRSKSRPRESAEGYGWTNEAEEALHRIKRKLNKLQTLAVPKEGEVIETIEEGSSVGIILVSPEEKMYSYAIRLKFNASNHAMDYEALLAGLDASVSKGLATIKLEFLNQEVSVGVKTRPSVEETSSSKKGKATSNVPCAKPTYNWEVSGSN